MNPQSKQVAHTPGPWHISSIGSDKYIATENVQICDMIRNGRDAEQLFEHDANARLIAAAPELLAACQAVLRLDYFCEHNALAEQVRTAICKATGGEV